MSVDAALPSRQVQVLTDALDLLRKYGWCQRRAYSNDGRLCMFAAIRQAGHLFVSGDFARLGIPWPAEFNDAPGRTFVEVEQWFLDRINEATTRERIA